MNKKLKQATKQEIQQAYQNQVCAYISNMRYYGRELNGVNEDTGECLYTNKFTPFMAERYNLGFEFRIWASNRDRKHRLRKRVEKIILTGKAQFLTLTFSPSFLARETSETTRRRYISRFLKEQCEEYVANVDYGDKNGREHYHAVVVPKNERIDYQPYCDFFDKSRIYAENVKINGKSATHIARYINKLTNHALKESGAYKRLIYSRR